MPGPASYEETPREKSILNLSVEAPGESLDHRPLELAVIHLTFEGIQIFGGGVSTVTRGHLTTLPRLQAELRQRNISLTPYFLEIAYDSSHPRYSEESLKAARSKIDAMGGSLEFLPNYTQGHEPNGPWGVPELGGIENWKVQSAAGASLALNIAASHDCAVMFCHDSVFALAGLYATLQADAFGADLVATYVGHASALTHEMPLPNPERLMAESAAVHWAKVSPRAKLGTISEFMARHFVEEYGADPDSVVPAVNGVDPLQSRFRQRDQSEIRETLLRYGVPVDRPLAVSFGRSVPYKRHDVFLKAASRLEDHAHPVLVTSSHYEELHELKADLGSDATLLAPFDVELMDSLLQWEKTQLAALLAFNEPCGIIPMEARLLARETGPVLLVSDSGGLAEQVADGVDGFVCRQDDPEDAARAMGEALDMSARRRREMRVAGLQTVLGNYTWSSNILDTLAACVPRVDAVAEDVRAAMDETERGFLADTSGSTKVEVS